MTADFFDRTLSEWTGYIILSFGFILTLIFQFAFYLKLLFIKKCPANGQEMPISVLMCVRNVEDKIEQVLLQLVEQDYKNFEIVVVDDFSEDSTLTHIGVLSKKYPKIKFSSLTQETHYSEKISINLALKAAKYDQVLFVSPEISELNSQYLKKINEYTGDNRDVILGYTNYGYQKGFINQLCRTERFNSFMFSAAFSFSRVPLFYNQNNVLFKRQYYFDMDGFRGFMNDHYANLELLLNKLKRGKIAVSLEEETQCREASEVQKNDFAELVYKRISLYRKLSFGKKLILSFVGLSKLTVLVGIIWLLITEIQNWLIFTPLVILLITIRAVILKSMLNRLQEKKIFLSSLVYVWVKPVIDLFFRLKLFTHFQHNRWN